MSSARLRFRVAARFTYTPFVPPHPRLTAVTLSLAYFAAAVLPCGVSGSVAVQGAAEPRFSPPSAARSIAQPEHAGHTPRAGRVLHESQAATPTHMEHPESGEGNGHANHLARTTHSDDSRPADETPTFIDAPCPCGCSQPNDAAAGGTARVGFALARVDWKRALEIAPLAHAARPRAYPTAPTAELDPVPT